MLLFFAVSGTIAYLNVKTLAKDSGLVAHTHEVLTTLSSLVSLTKDAETGQRGYLLTGKEEYLEPYTSATTRIYESFAAVVIGTSAGGVDALTTVLQLLPADFRLPVMIVIHLPANKQSIISELLDPQCKIPVREAEDKEPIAPGAIYFAPSDYHLLIEPDFRLSLSSEEPVKFSRPSIDVLFESAAESYRDGLIGVILTGANDDGSNGLKCVEKQGGVTIVQLPSTALSGEMPRAALLACPNSRVMTLTEIAAYLVEAAVAE